MAVQTSVPVAPAVAFAGMLADANPMSSFTLRNSEASASMPFGAIVAFKTSSPASAEDSILPAASTAKIAGVIIHRHNYERTFTLPDGTTVGELDSTGLVVGIPFSCLRAGRIYVTCEDGCNVGDRLFIRYAGGTLGAARSTDAGGSTCIDATNMGQWLSVATAGQVALLEVDFRNK